MTLTPKGEASAKGRADGFSPSRMRWPRANELRRPSSRGMPHSSRVSSPCHPNPLVPSRQYTLVIAARGCLHPPPGAQVKPKRPVLPHRPVHRTVALQPCWGILGGSIFKLKRKEVQKLTSIVGLAREEGGGRASPFRRTQTLLKSKLARIEQLRALPSAGAKAAPIHWHQR